MINELKRELRFHILINYHKKVKIWQGFYFICQFFVVKQLNILNNYFIDLDYEIICHWRN